MPWRSADLVFAPGAARTQCSALTLLPMQTAIPWKTKTSQAGDYVNIGVQSFRRALKARGTISTKPSCGSFGKLLTTFAENSTETNLLNTWPHKKESAPGPDGIPDSLCRCAGGLGSQFLYKAYKHVIEDFDNNGRTVRSPKTLRPLTLLLRLQDSHHGPHCLGKSMLRLSELRRDMRNFL